MAAPIRKVAPNAFAAGAIQTAVDKGAAALQAAESKPIHDSLSAFGVIVSSTAPGLLHRSAAARAQIRRGMRLG